MSRFVILLGGEVLPTPRLARQISHSRIIAADAGMKHASSLALLPELWVGDFDSAEQELQSAHAAVPRQTHSMDKDMSDGELAIREALQRGASQLVLVGGFGGQADHVLAHFGQILLLRKQGISSFMTSGDEEAYPVIPGTTRLELPPSSRLSILPLCDLQTITLEGVRWPLDRKDVPLGSTLTLSNVATGPVRIALAAGHAIAIAYPADLDG